MLNYDKKLIIWLQIDYGWDGKIGENLLVFKEVEIAF